MADSDFTFLIRWFETHCDGDWEHDLGIRLVTLDNPGWALSIRIEETELEGQVVEWRRADESVDQWLHWRATGVMFEARCGTSDLERALGAFRKFAEGPGESRRS